MTDATTDEPRAFVFTGTWREFAPIAFTNLLLTIVTLGIYQFWAKTRVRRYLWSRTRFIDDTLEWTGTGLELFVGYLLAFLLFLIPFGLLNLLIHGVLLRGHPGAAGLIGFVSYLVIFFLIGVATFRALRYRLSRTFWHGIRGGSDEQGFGYGGQYFWRTIVGFLAAGLMVPWSMTTLWNRRWAAMSFGPLRFAADARWQPIFPRYLIFYAAPFVITIVLLVGGLMLAGIGAAFGWLGGGDPSGGAIVVLALVAGALYLLFFGVLGLVALLYYAAYYREAVGSLTLGEISFTFDARAMDWVKLWLGNIALLVVTLGVGYIFWSYRNWAFFIRHIEAYGTVHLDDLTRSTTRAPGQGEGLLDAFDIGAF